MARPDTVDDLVDLRESFINDAKETNSDMLMAATAMISCTILLVQTLERLVQILDAK